ncbi:MAG: hypothetical protein KGJ07_05855 [Patescibacteria group bacterium]|nr:hypothetical protein [Patescibacteria group bacterium]
MDATQILLLIVVVVLSLILLILGIQIFFILREFKRTISKVNKVLDDTGNITQSVSAPIASISSVLTSVKLGSVLLKLFQNKKTKHVRHEGEEDGQE